MVVVSWRRSSTAAADCANIASHEVELTDLITSQAKSARQLHTCSGKAQEHSLPNLLPGTQYQVSKTCPSGGCCYNSTRALCCVHAVTAGLLSGTQCQACKIAPSTGFCSDSIPALCWTQAMTTATAVYATAAEASRGRFHEQHFQRGKAASAEAADWRLHVQWHMYLVHLAGILSVTTVLINELVQSQPVQVCSVMCEGDAS